VSERSSLRLVVLGVLVISLMVTLVGRLFELQVVRAEEYQTRATDNRTREVITTPQRGFILDQTGRPLVSNRSSLVVTVDRTIVGRLPDRGTAVFERLAALLDVSAESLQDRIRPCGTTGAKKPPICWNGSPVQPVPVAKDVSTDIALSILEQPLNFPGVNAQVEQVRNYANEANFGANAAHVVGYLGPVSEDELAKQRELPPEERTLRRNDLIGRAGLEAMYDQWLRGVPGIKTLTVDRSSNVVGVASEVPPTPGNHLVTSIDARLQAVAEEQLMAAIERARETVDRTSGKKYAGDSGAVVVMDVTNGQVLAMASYPSYDPAVWVGGISKTEYDRLISKDAGEPLLFRPTQGLFPPGSTFKVISTAAALTSGWSTNSVIGCPSSLSVSGRTMRNFESRPYGSISFARALEVSCNTVYYRVGYDLWLRDGGLRAKSGAKEAMLETARAFGLGTRTGIDLPREARGQVVGRKERIASYETNKDTWCRRGQEGYPELKKSDPERARYLQAIARENCVDGHLFRGGDAALFAIGQGETLVTPLQMASVYAAIANGGTLWRPTVAKAVVTPSGTVVKEFKPQKNGTLPLDSKQIEYLQKSLVGVVNTGSAAWRFQGFPLDQVQVAAKTGTAQMGGNQQDTSWFVTYAPADKPKYAILMMVGQGGTGSGTSAPSVRAIYEAIYGIEGRTVDPSKSILAGGAPMTSLPKFRGDGAPITPEMIAARAGADQ
jgi:penicillin-binding protein 2